MFIKSKLFLSNIGTINASSKAQNSFSFISGVVVEAKYSKTRMGNARLIDPDGFTYCMKQKSNKRVYWICNKIRKHKCKGTAITEGIFIVRFSSFNGHTHDPSPDLNFDDSPYEINYSEEYSNQTENYTC